MFSRGRLLSCMLAGTVGSVLVGGVAQAQTPAADPRMFSLPFTLTDRVDGTSGGDLQHGLTYFSDTGSVFGLRLDAFFQAFTASGLGAYGSVPLSAAFTTEGEGDSIVGVGNIEAGGAYARRSGQVALVLRGGLTAPTASSGLEGAAANLINAYGRVSDLALIAPEMSFARLSASGILFSGNLFARGDLGFDVPVWHSDEVGDADTLTHVTFGVGAVSPPSGTSFTAEFSNVSGWGDSLSTLALGVGFKGGTYLSVVAPLDDGPRGEVIIFKAGFRIGGGSSESSSTSSSLAADAGGDSSICAHRVAAWRAETDLIHKTQLYEEMPERCQDEASRPQPQPPAIPEIPPLEPQSPATSDDPGQPIARP